MKKLLTMLLALVMVLSLCACGVPAVDASEPSEKETVTEPTNNAAVEKYIEKNKETLLSSMEASFATSSGMTCVSDLQVDGDGFVITIKINELEDVDEATKNQLQSVYDQNMDTFNQSLALMQKEVPEIKYYKVLVCEKDGDLLAEIHAK